MGVEPSVICGRPGSGKTSLAAFAAANRCKLRILCTNQLLHALEDGNNALVHNVYLRNRSTLVYRLLSLSPKQPSEEVEVALAFPRHVKVRKRLTSKSICKLS